MRKELTRIDIPKPETWPEDVISVLVSNLRIFWSWETSASTKSAAEYDRAIYAVEYALKPYFMTGWHCTRLTDTEAASILAHGMQLPNKSMLNARIDAAVNAVMITPDVADALKNRNQAHEMNRAGRIWFCFFPPRNAGQGGIERFFRFWGGEALYNLHENNPITASALRRVGSPCLVEADVPIHSLPEHNSLVFKIVRSFLISRGLETSEPIDHEDRAIDPIPASRVRRIIRFPDQDFLEMTGCHEWKLQLE